MVRYVVTVRQTRNKDILSNEWSKLNFTDAIKETKKYMEYLYKCGYRETFWTWDITKITIENGNYNYEFVCKGNKRFSKEDLQKLIDKYEGK